MTTFSEPTLTGLFATEFKDARADKVDKEGHPLVLKIYDVKTGKEVDVRDPAVLKKYEKMDKLAKTLGPTLFLLLLMIGRIAGGAVLTVLHPRTFFRISALLGLIGAALFMADNQWLGIAGVVAAGLGFANIWPLLFSITVEEKPECSNELSGLMCMAIAGGAIVPLGMGQLRDWRLGVFAFIVPTICFIYLLLLAMYRGTQAKA